MTLNFCTICGGSLQLVAVEHWKCSGCERNIFANAKLGSTMMLFDGEGRVLLGARAFSPQKGMLDFVGGFAELAETIEESLVREIEEETGLLPSDYSTPIYIGSSNDNYHYQDTDYNCLSCVFVATIRPGAIVQPNDDIAEIIWLKPEDIDRSKIAFPKQFDDFFAKAVDWHSSTNIN
jgi:NADH pyrophosphatase NudC (nudix superfamily)